MFLNSGYGGDDLFHYRQVAVAGSITVLPTRGNLRFGDLIRFDPWPDFRSADNTAVHRGFACGANLRGIEKWCELTGTSATGPWFLLDLSTGQAGKLGIYVAAYRTVPAEATAQPPGIGWPETRRLLYVMEAGMPFGQFSRIVDQNSFPEVLEAITNYVLNTPDGHRFEFGIFPVTTGSSTWLRP